MLRRHNPQKRKMNQMILIPSQTQDCNRYLSNKKDDSTHTSVKSREGRTKLNQPPTKYITKWYSNMEQMRNPPKECVVS
jgi:ubiquitin